MTFRCSRDEIYEDYTRLMSIHPIEERIESLHELIEHVESLINEENKERGEKEIVTLNKLLRAELELRDKENDSKQ
jgi:hypothetical protein